MYFVYPGFENIVKLLIESHAEIDVKDNNGKIPIFFAAQNGNGNYFICSFTNNIH